MDIRAEVNYLQHRPCVTYINRVAIQQRFLVEFSCDPYINSPLRALLVCVIIGPCIQWLPQHYRFLKQLSIPKHPWNSISIYFIKKLLSSSRFDTILVISNQFTKQAILIAVHNTYHIQVHPSRNYIPIVILSLNHTSPPSIAATFLITYLMVVLQPSRYSIFYGENTPIQLGLL